MYIFFILRGLKTVPSAVQYSQIQPRAKVWYLTDTYFCLLMCAYMLVRLYFIAKVKELICTKQSFPKKKFERRDDSKLHSYTCFC